MSLATLKCFVVSAALVQVSLWSPSWARASTSARHYFSTSIAATDQHHDSVQHAVLALSE